MQGAGNLGGDPDQPHPGTRVDNYRCSLPGLAGFAIYRCERTDQGHHCKVAHYL